MRKEIRFAGFGGQGVVKSAIILATASGLHENMEVVQTQSYGPESRGGACRADVVISNEEIGFIKPIQIDYLVVMSQTALDKYAVSINEEETVVIADLTFINDPPTRIKKFYGVYATRIAENELGKALYANIIMLGVFGAITGLISLSALEKAIASNVPKTTLDSNLAALGRGYQLGSEIGS